jgi:dihydrofolate reductase
MSSSSRIRVYMACSFDGFIAGPDDDLSWLEPPPAPSSPEPSGALEFEPFMAQIGAMVMGRRTYDAVEAMGQWMYGDVPVHVVTHRPLDPVQSSVRPVAGEIDAILEAAKAEAGDKDVYLDGGALVRQAVDAGLVDEMIITMIPILLGAGVRLFDGLTKRQSLRFVSHHRLAGSMLQVTCEPA